MGNQRMKAVAALASAGLIMASLAACSSAGGAGGGATLNVYVGANGALPQEQQAWMKATADKFKAQTGASITWDTYASATDEQTKIQTSVVSGQGPDIYAIGTTFTPTAYATGAFVKLGEAEWKRIGGRDKFVPSTLGISGPDASNEIAVPFASRPFVMAYNTELLKAAGITKMPTTWDEFTADAKKLTKGDQYGIATDYKDGFSPWKYIWGMASQAGNPLVDGKTARIDDPTVKKAYETYFGWLTTDKVVNPASIGWNNAAAVAAFAEGKTGFLPMISTTTAISLDKGAVKGKYAFALLPTVPPGATTRPSNGAEAASILSGDNLVVAQYSKNKDLALDFVKMVTDKDAQLEFVKAFGGFPTNAEAAASLSSNPAAAAPLEAQKKSVATPFTGAWSDIQLALTNVVVQTIPDLSSGSVSADQIAQRVGEAQKTAQSALDRAK